MSDPRVVVGVANLKITDGVDDATIDCRYLIVNPRQARLIAVQLLAGADTLVPPTMPQWSAAVSALTAERDSLIAHVEAQDARIKGLEATIAAAKVSP